MSGKIRHFLDLNEIPPRDLRSILDASRAMKRARQRGKPAKRPLAGKMLALIFDKPSTRTRRLANEEAMPAADAKKAKKLLGR